MKSRIAAASILLLTFVVTGCPGDHELREVGVNDLGSKTIFFDADTLPKMGELYRRHKNAKAEPWERVGAIELNQGIDCPAAPNRNIPTDIVATVTALDNLENALVSDQIVALIARAYAVKQVVEKNEDVIKVLTLEAKSDAEKQVAAGVGSLFNRVSEAAEVRFRDTGKIIFSQSGMQGEASTPNLASRLGLFNLGANAQHQSLAVLVYVAAGTVAMHGDVTNCYKAAIKRARSTADGSALDTSTYDYGVLDSATFGASFRFAITANKVGAAGSGGNGNFTLKASFDASSYQLGAAMVGSFNDLGSLLSQENLKKRLADNPDPAGLMNELRGKIKQAPYVYGTIVEVPF